MARRRPTQTSEQSQNAGAHEHTVLDSGYAAHIPGTCHRLETAKTPVQLQTVAPKGNGNGGTRP